MLDAETHTIDDLHAWAEDSSPALAPTLVMEPQNATRQDKPSTANPKMSPLAPPVMKKNSAVPARERVYEFVRHAILIGTYPGGTFIEEEEISLQVGVSRTPVREAFGRLDSEKYLDLVPRKGALVRQVSPRELSEMYQARLLIEGSVVDLICSNRTPISPEIPRLLESMREITVIAKLEDQLEFIGLDWCFHCAIVEMSGNSVLVEIYKSLRSRFDRIFRSINITPDHLRKVHAQHINMLGLLQTYDAAGLRSSLKEHFRVS